MFKLQSSIKVMPTALVATILLLYRKGIAEETLLQKITWLGMAIKQRGAHLSDTGLPDQTTLAIGLKHLKDYYVQKRDVIMPVVRPSKDQNVDYTAYTMLNYYRNPLNHIFFNESLIVCSMFSMGEVNAWKNGVNVDELFERTCYLSNLLKREEVLKERITKKTREVFDRTLSFMEGQRLTRKTLG